MSKSSSECFHNSQCSSEGKSCCWYDDSEMEGVCGSVCCGYIDKDSEEWMGFACEAGQTCCGDSCCSA